MYDIAMSSKASYGEFDTRDASYIGPAAEVEYISEFNDLDFKDEPKSGLGSFLIKGGILCLVAAVMLTGYQFIPVGTSQKSTQEVASLHDWDKKADKVAGDSDFLVAVERRFAAAKKLDMSPTASTMVTRLIENSKVTPDQMGLKADQKVFKADQKGLKAERSEASKAKMYIVQAGDTLSKIARMFKISSNTIIAMNDIENPSLIRPGMRLVVTK